MHINILKLNIAVKMQKMKIVFYIHHANVEWKLSVWFYDKNSQYLMTNTSYYIQHCNFSFFLQKWHNGQNQDQMEGMNYYAYWLIYIMQMQKCIFIFLQNNHTLEAWYKYSTTLPFITLYSLFLRFILKLLNTENIAELSSFFLTTF